MKHLAILTLLLAVLAPAAPAGAAVAAVDEVPAATLLLPYFEVDLSPVYSGPVTIFSIGNASATAVVAKVTLWTDRGVPTYAFDIYLTGYDLEFVDLRLLFDGIPPVTADAGTDFADVVSPRGLFSQDINYPGTSPPCGGLYTRLSEADVAALRAAHTGQASALLGGQCGAVDHGDGLARGFVTVDTVNQCSAVLPTDPTYFTSIVTFQNVLFGEYWIVDRAQNFAYGDSLTAVEASTTDPRTDGAGDYTFYGRLANVNGSGADHREGLPTTWMGRFADGGAFSAGTDALVWRDAWPAAPFACASPPAELDQAQLLAFDEEENPYSLATDEVFGLAAQRVQLADPAQIPLVPLFGFLYYDLQRQSASSPFGVLGQAVVTQVFSAAGRFSGAYAAWPLDSASAPLPPLVAAESATTGSTSTVTISSTTRTTPSASRPGITPNASRRVP